MTNQQPASVGPSELPYMDDYLREVLRPRVEAALRSIEASLNDAIWRQLVIVIGGDQAANNPATQAMIRSLIAERLGLNLQGRIDSTFVPGAAPAARPAEPAPGPVVVTRRPPGAASPLVSAVLSNPRPPAR